MAAVPRSLAAAEEERWRPQTNARPRPWRTVVGGLVPGVPTGLAARHAVPWLGNPLEKTSSALRREAQGGAPNRGARHLTATDRGLSAALPDKETLQLGQRLKILGHSSLASHPQKQHFRTYRSPNPLDPGISSAAEAIEQMDATKRSWLDRCCLSFAVPRHDDFQAARASLQRLGTSACVGRWTPNSSAKISKPFKTLKRS